MEFPVKSSTSVSLLSRAPSEPLLPNFPPTDQRVLEPEDGVSQRSKHCCGPHRPPRAVLTHCWEVHTGRSIQCDSGSQQTNQLSPTGEARCVEGTP